MVRNTSFRRDLLEISLPSLVLLFFGAPLPLDFKLWKKPLVHLPNKERATGMQTLSMPPIDPLHHRPRFPCLDKELLVSLLWQPFLGNIQPLKALSAFRARSCCRLLVVQDCRSWKICGTGPIVYVLTPEAQRNLVYNFTFNKSNIRDLATAMMRIVEKCVWQPIS